MKYRTVENIEGVIYKEKASKFIGYAYFVDNELAIKEYINYVKQMHKKASHHCFAYRLGFDDNNFRAFDDGEPSGTAGKPILQ
ncbi:MAG: YigZ family protein [Chitinophagales bacterium]